MCCYSYMCRFSTINHSQSLTRSISTYTHNTHCAKISVFIMQIICRLFMPLYVIFCLIQLKFEKHDIIIETSLTLHNEIYVCIFLSDFMLLWLLFSCFYSVMNVPYWIFACCKFYFWHILSYQLYSWSDGSFITVALNLWLPAARVPITNKNSLKHKSINKKFINSTSNENLFSIPEMSFN